MRRGVQRGGGGQRGDLGPKGCNEGVSAAAGGCTGGAPVVEGAAGQVLECKLHVADESVSCANGRMNARADERMNALLCPNFSTLHIMTYFVVHEKQRNSQIKAEAAQSTQDRLRTDIVTVGVELVAVCEAIALKRQCDRHCFFVCGCDNKMHEPRRRPSAALKSRCKNAPKMQVENAIGVRKFRALYNSFW